MQLLVVDYRYQRIVTNLHPKQIIMSVWGVLVSGHRAYFSKSSMSPLQIKTSRIKMGDDDLHRWKIKLW